MSDIVEFIKFDKIPRLEKHSVLVTEKLDGTNAQIIVPESPDDPVLVGSRNRWITPGKQTDNYGFAAWVHDNEAALRRLGPGRHYGEWYGQGIGRNYGLTTRRWALFNVDMEVPEGVPVEQVPVLYRRQLTFLFDYRETEAFSHVVCELEYQGSKAVPGFLNPEGVVITVGGHRFKHIFSKTGPSPEETN